MSYYAKQPYIDSRLHGSKTYLSPDHRVQDLINMGWSEPQIQQYIDSLLAAGHNPNEVLPQGFKEDVPFLQQFTGMGAPRRLDNLNALQADTGRYEVNSADTFFDWRNATTETAPVVNLSQHDTNLGRQAPLRPGNHNVTSMEKQPGKNVFDPVTGQLHLRSTQPILSIEPVANTLVRAQNIRQSENYPGSLNSAKTRKDFPALVSAFSDDPSALPLTIDQLLEEKNPVVNAQGQVVGYSRPFTAQTIATAYAQDSEMSEGARPGLANALPLAVEYDAMLETEMQGGVLSDAQLQRKSELKARLAGLAATRYDATTGKVLGKGNANIPIMQKGGARNVADFTRKNEAFQRLAGATSNQARIADGVRQQQEAKRIAGQTGIPYVAYTPQLSLPQQEQMIQIVDGTREEPIPVSSKDINYYLAVKGSREEDAAAGQINPNPGYLYDDALSRSPNHNSFDIPQHLYTQQLAQEQIADIEAKSGRVNYLIGQAKQQQDGVKQQELQGYLNNLQGKKRALLSEFSHLGQINSRITPQEYEARREEALAERRKLRFENHYGMNPSKVPEGVNPAVVNEVNTQVAGHYNRAKQLRAEGDAFRAVQMEGIRMAAQQAALDQGLTGEAALPFINQYIQAHEPAKTSTNLKVWTEADSNFATGVGAVDPEYQSYVKGMESPYQDLDAVRYHPNYFGFQTVPASATNYIQTPDGIVDIRLQAAINSGKTSPAELVAMGLNPLEILSRNATQYHLTNTVTPQYQQIINQHPERLKAAQQIGMSAFDKKAKLAMPFVLNPAVADRLTPEQADRLAQNVVQQRMIAAGNNPDPALANLSQSEVNALITPKVEPSGPLLGMVGQLEDAAGDASGYGPMSDLQVNVEELKNMGWSDRQINEALPRLQQADPSVITKAQAGLTNTPVTLPWYVPSTYMRANPGAKATANVENASLNSNGTATLQPNPHSVVVEEQGGLVNSDGGRDWQEHRLYAGVEPKVKGLPSGAGEAPRRAMMPAKIETPVENVDAGLFSFRGGGEGVDGTLSDDINGLQMLAAMDREENEINMALYTDPSSRVNKGVRPSLDPAERNLLTARLNAIRQNKEALAQQMKARSEFELLPEGQVNTTNATRSPDYANQQRTQRAQRLEQQVQDAKPGIKAPRNALTDIVGTYDTDRLLLAEAEKYLDDPNSTTQPLTRRFKEAINYTQRRRSNQSRWDSMMAPAQEAWTQTFFTPEGQEQMLRHPQFHQVLDDEDAAGQLYNLLDEREIRRAKLSDDPTAPGQGFVRARLTETEDALQQVVQPLAQRFAGLDSVERDRFLFEHLQQAEPEFAQRYGYKVVESAPGTGGGDAFSSSYSPRSRQRTRRKIGDIQQDFIARYRQPVERPAPTTPETSAAQKVLAETLAQPDAAQVTRPAALPATVRNYSLTRNALPGIIGVDSGVDTLGITPVVRPVMTHAGTPVTASRELKLQEALRQKALADYKNYQQADFVDAPAPAKAAQQAPSSSNASTQSAPNPGPTPRSTAKAADTVNDAGQSVGGVPKAMFSGLPDGMGRWAIPTAVIAGTVGTLGYLNNQRQQEQRKAQLAQPVYIR